MPTSETPAGTSDAAAAAGVALPAGWRAAVVVPFLGFFGAVQGAAPNIASTALVGASRSLGMDAGAQALAASVQTLAIAATVITTGMLADRYGRRLVLMVALVVGAAGNLVVLASPDVAVYLAGMVLVGVGLGAVYGAAFGFLKSLVAPERLAGAMGVFTASIMVFTVVLTFVGGTLAAGNWRTAYLLIPAMCLVGLALTPVLLPEVPTVRGGSVDLLGQALLAVGIVAVLYGISRTAVSLTDPLTVGPIVVGLALLVAFVVHEHRSPHAFFPVALLRTPVFLAALCSGFVYMFGTAVSFLQLTNLWQYVNGLTTARIAVWQLPLLVAGVLGGLAGGRVLARGVSNRTVGAVAGALSAAGFVWLGLVHAATGIVPFLPGMVLVGAGVVVAAVPFGNLILREAPAAYLGPVSSSRTTFGQIFMTLGYSLSAVAIDRLTRGGVLGRLTDAGVPANQLSTGMDAVTVYASSGTRPDTPLGTEAMADAVASYGSAFRTTFLICAGVLLVAAALGWWLLRHGEGGPPAAPTPAATPAPAAGA